MLFVEALHTGTPLGIELGAPLVLVLIAFGLTHTFSIGVISSQISSKYNSLVFIVAPLLVYGICRLFFGVAFAVFQRICKVYSVPVLVRVLIAVAIFSVGPLVLVNIGFVRESITELLAGVSGPIFPPLYEVLLKELYSSMSSFLKMVSLLLCWNLLIYLFELFIRMGCWIGRSGLKTTVHLSHRYWTKSKKH